MNMLNSKNETAGETAIQVFSSDKFGTIRTAGTAENPLFCLADLCRALEIKNASDAKKKYLNQKGVVSIYTPTAGGKQKLLYINEANLYRLILRSDKPQAEPFQEWVCEEVLPAIRKSGGYVVAAPAETPEQIMARALKVADETLRRQQAQIQAAQGTIEAQSAEIKALAPLADYTKEVLQSNATYTLTQVSKDLGFPSVYKFTAWAHLAGILYFQSRQWMPTSRCTGKGWFTTRTCKFVRTDGSIGSNISTVVTEAGRAMLHEALRRWKQRAAAQAAQAAQPAQPEPVYRIDPDWRPSETVIIEEGGAR